MNSLPVEAVNRLKGQRRLVVHCLDQLGIGGIQEMGFNLFKRSRHLHAWWVVARGGTFEPEMERAGMPILTDPSGLDVDVLVGHTVGGWSYDEKFTWARSYGVKTVEVMHSNANSPTNPSLVDAFIGVSETAAKMGIANWFKSACIYPPIIAEFKPRRRERPRVVGRLSRLAPEKSPVVFAEVAARFPRLHFVLAGDGPERGRIEAANLPNLQTPGWVRDFPAFYFHTDLFLFPTRDECNCVSVAMAQLAGAPVICQDTPALRETTGGNAYFVRGGVNEFSDALLFALNNWGHFLGLAEAGRAWSESRYGLKETIGKWDDLVDGLCTQPPLPSFVPLS